MSIASGQTAAPNVASDAIDPERIPNGGGGWANAWSLADQAVVSLGNFFTNLLLVRSLVQKEYGALGLLVGVLMFLNNLHASLITYPLTVKGAASDDAGLRRLSGVSLLLTVVLGIPLSIAAIGASAAVGKLALAPWVILALLMWQIQETLRRGLMAHLRYRDAFWGDALSYLGQAACVWWLTRGAGSPSLAKVFGLMAATSAAAAALQAIQLRLSHEEAPHAVRTALTYWNIGRWMTFANLVTVVNVQLLPWTLRIFHGLTEVAKLSALGPILNLTNPMVFSLGNLIVPATARANQRAGRDAALQVGWRYSLMGAAVVMPYYLLVIAAPGLALRLFCGPNSPYLSLHAPMRLFALAFAIMYVANMICNVLNGLEKSRAAFAAQVVSVAVTCVLTLPLARWGGVTWGLVGGCASVAAGALVGGWLLYRRSTRAPIVETHEAASAQPAPIVT